MRETIQFNLFQDAVKFEREAHQNSFMSSVMMRFIRRVHLVLIHGMIMIVVLNKVTFLVLNLGKKEGCQ
jgi:hypothetical protein